MIAKIGLRFFQFSMGRKIMNMLFYYATNVTTQITLLLFFPPCLPYAFLFKTEKSVSVSVMSNSLWPHGLYSLWNSLGQNTGVGSLSLLRGIFSTQGSKPGLLHCRQILYHLSHQGSPKILEWVAYPFSKGLPDPGIKPGFPALQADSIPTELSGKPSFP